MQVNFIYYCLSEYISNPYRFLDVSIFFNVQSDVRNWVHDRLGTVPSVHVASADQCLNHAEMLITVLKEVMAALQPCQTLARFFSKVGIDYFKVSSLLMESKVWEKI